MQNMHTTCKIRHFEGFFCCWSTFRLRIGGWRWREDIDEPIRLIGWYNNIRRFCCWWHGCCIWRFWSSQCVHKHNQTTFLSALQKTDKFKNWLWCFLLNKVKQWASYTSDIWINMRQIRYITITVTRYMNMQMNSKKL